MKVTYKIIMTSFLMTAILLPAYNWASAATEITSATDTTEELSTVLTPNDWEYKSIQLLIKHGAITDTKGITLGEESCTVETLMPLIIDAVENQKNFNENDRVTTSRLETRFTKSIREYKMNQLMAEADAERAKKDVAEQNRNSKLTKEEQERYAQAEEASLTPRKMSQAEIDKKMKKFRVDDSRVKVSGDVRIRYSNGTDSEKSKTDMRTRVETKISF